MMFFFFNILNFTPYKPQIIQGRGLLNDVCDMNVRRKYEIKIMGIWGIDNPWLDEVKHPRGCLFLNVATLGKKLSETSFLSMEYRENDCDLTLRMHLNSNLWHERIQIVWIFVMEIVIV